MKTLQSLSNNVYSRFLFHALEIEDRPEVAEKEKSEGVGMTGGGKTLSIMTAVGIFVVSILPSKLDANGNNFTLISYDGNRQLTAKLIDVDLETKTITFNRGSGPEVFPFSYFNRESLVDAYNTIQSRPVKVKNLQDEGIDNLDRQGGKLIGFGNFLTGEPASSISGTDVVDLQFTFMGKAVQIDSEGNSSDEYLNKARTGERFVDMFTCGLGLFLVDSSGHVYDAETRSIMKHKDASVKLDLNRPLETQIVRMFDSIIAIVDEELRVVRSDRKMINQKDLDSLNTKPVKSILGNDKFLIVLYDDGDVASFIRTNADIDNKLFSSKMARNKLGKGFFHKEIRQVISTLNRSCIVFEDGSVNVIEANDIGDIKSARRGSGIREIEQIAKEEPKISVRVSNPGEDGEFYVSSTGSDGSAYLASTEDIGSSVHLSLLGEGIEQVIVFSKQGSVATWGIKK